MSGDDLWRLADETYDAALDAARWPRVLERLAQNFSSASAHLSLDNFNGTEGAIVSFGTDPVFAKRYADHYVTCNVLWHRAVHRSLSGVITNRILMPQEELRRSEFFNDYLRPQDGGELLILIALRGEESATNITLWRPERLGAWEKPDMERLAALTPHLRRALQVNQRIGDLGMMSGLAGEALHRMGEGVVLVRGEAQVLFANRAAEAILADGAGLRLDGRRLAARRTADTAALRRLIAGAPQSGGGSLVIAREERPSLLVLVIPMRAETRWHLHDSPSAVVFITDPERPAKPSLAAFAAYFGLTPAQAALAREMVRGDGVAAAAARLKISYATARVHLPQIFQKTATRRQAELVRLMMEWNERPIA